MTLSDRMRTIAAAAFLSQTFSTAVYADQMILNEENSYIRFSHLEMGDISLIRPDKFKHSKSSPWPYLPAVRQNSVTIMLSE